MEDKDVDNMKLDGGAQVAKGLICGAQIVQGGSQGGADEHSI